MHSRTSTQRRFFRCRFHGGGGFTILETLIGLTILSVGILSMIGIIPGILKGQRESELLTKAALLAQLKMTELRRDDASANLIQTIISRNDTDSVVSETDPIVFENEPALAYAFCSKRMKPSDPKPVACVRILRNRGQAPKDVTPQDVIYELYLK